MNINRIAKHLVMTHWQVKRAFPHKTLMAIERAIKASEASHCGEIRFVVEGALDNTSLLNGQSARERAIDVFSQLRMWDTEHNNGVLIYLLLADRNVEIVADRGIHAKAGSREWDSICRKMESAFKQANYEAGAVNGIQAVTQHLTQHFPSTSSEKRELPNRPVML
jgi:uncharacterized membrane protein